MPESWRCRCRWTACDSRAVRGAVHAWRCRRSIGWRSATAQAADLGHENLLLLEDGHCLRDQALDICASTAVPRKQDFRATSLETLRQMVAAGRGHHAVAELARARRLR